jgi:MFS family permease
MARHRSASFDAEFCSAPKEKGKNARPFLVIGGASLGTLFEWYDFFLYGTMAAFIAQNFFVGVSEGNAYIFALATFAAGTAIRPLGALLFGRLGDLIGRKHTFLITLSIMGLATFSVGLLPGAATIGLAAPLLLVAIRLLQGLAIGGEFGGAAVYVAEHAPPGQSGLHVSWIQAMAPGGLVLALLILIGFRLTMSEEEFASWGWRLPFLISILLLAISLWIRLKLRESPVFAHMKAQDTVSKAPLSEAFAHWGNLKLVLLATAWVVGGASIAYTAYLYPLFFLERVLKVDGLHTEVMTAVALTAALPSFMFFGWLSDRIGRKILMLVSLSLFAVSLFPAFHLLTTAANPLFAQAHSKAPVSVYADPAACSLQFDPIGLNKFDERSCDIAKAFLSKAGISYRNVPLEAGAASEIRVGERILRPPSLYGLNSSARAVAIAAFETEAKSALAFAGYPAAADPARIKFPLVISILAYLVIVGAMGFSPALAFLVELFPARIRYTSLSLPYHVGNGWIGGFMPATAFAIVAASGNIYAGLWYPFVFVAASAILVTFLMPETRGRAISA